MNAAAAFTALAILAFAGNSLLTRAALAEGAIGAGAFAAIRILAGAVTLAALVQFDVRRLRPSRRDVPGVLSLLAYMAFFTWAYRELGAAAGALILFAMVQLTMAGVSIVQARPPSAWESLGLAIAFAGLAWLLAPGLAAPPLAPALLMACAGVAWGFYTLLGRGAADPVAVTARNFLGCAPLGLLLPLGDAGPSLSPLGVGLAVAAGALTSGLGYALWYAALPRLSVPTAGAAQLLAPAVAAAGATVWLGEPLSARLLGASVAILAGVGVTILARETKGGWRRLISKGDAVTTEQPPKPQAANARKAQRIKREKAKPDTPHPGKATPDEGADPLSQNDIADMESSARIGGQPAAMGRSHGVRKSDQG